MDEKLIQLITESTPKRLSLYIGMLEEQSDHNLNDFIQGVKACAFSKMLTGLNINRHVWKSYFKRYKTALYINMEINDIVLFVSKKDSLDISVVYASLYDKHKDELLQIIESKSGAFEATPAREVVVV